VPLSASPVIVHALPVTVQGEPAAGQAMADGPSRVSAAPGPEGSARTRPRGDQPAAPPPDRDATPVPTPEADADRRTDRDAAPDTDPGARPPGVLGELVTALRGLRTAILSSRYALPLPSAKRAGALGQSIVAQLDDYLLPRLGRLDAPLLVVVGGSTGAGKSTLVNSMVRAPVSLAGVLRPTTRAPVLVCNPADAVWFMESHLLPGLVRSTSKANDTNTLQVVTAPALISGLALLDAPDIDSVVDSNRALAAQLLAAADLWLFVTTAARYADAVPWDTLQTAAQRGTAIALVLDRVPAGAAEAIEPHLTAMLRAYDLGAAPLFVLPETHLDGQGLLPEKIIKPLRGWLDTLAKSAAARAAVVRQTVDGAIAALDPAAAALAAAADDQIHAAESLETSVRAAYRGARSTVEQGVRDGALLRGEVLARWQELVGTGELMRALQVRIGRLRDRLAAAITGRIPSGEKFQAAIESGVAALIRSAATDAAEQAATAWRLHPAGEALLRTAQADGVDLAVPGADLADRVQRLVRDWQRGLLELVRTEAGDRRAFAVASAYAVNATGLLVMVSVFAATSFIPTGAEIAVAGGTTIAAQKVLEAIFGDQAVRRLADRARDDLLDRAQALLAEEAARFTAVLAAAEVDAQVAERLRAAAREVAAARAAAPLPAHEVSP
jgi:hypothetical protein